MMQQTDKPARPGGPVNGPAGERPGGLVRDQRGSIVILFSLMLPVLVAFIGLGTEVAYWFTIKRDIQSAVDAAAVAGSWEIAEDRFSGVAAAAQKAAESNGWSASSGAMTIRNFRYNSTYPASGAYTTDANAVEIELTTQINRLFTSWFSSGAININARAVGLSTIGVNDTCLLALGNSNQDKALWISGTASINLNDCAAASNSTGASGIDATSGLQAECVYSAGGVAGNPITTGCSGARSNQPAVVDPYEATVTKPSDSDFADCASNGGDYSLIGAGSTDTIYDTDGPFCSITVNVVNGTLTMELGIYYIDRGNFTIQGSDLNDLGTVNALDGVTIVLGDSTGGGACGSLTVGGKSSLNIVAPTSGNFSGLAVYRGSDCDSSGSIVYNGTTDSDITGAIYNPSGAIKLIGTGAIGGTCMQAIGDSIKMTGDTQMGNSCGAAGTRTIVAGAKGGLVE